MAKTKTKRRPRRRDADILGPAQEPEEEPGGLEDDLEDLDEEFELPVRPLPKGPYYKPFGGIGAFFSAVKPERRFVLIRGRERERIIHAAEGVAVSGVHFARKTSRVTEIEEGADEEEGGMWLALTAPEPGEKVRLAWRQLERLLERLRSKVVRWNHADPKKRVRASIIDMADVRYVYDQTKPGCPGIAHGWRHHPMPQDEPLAKHLVLLRWRDLERFGGREGILRMPTIADLHPEVLGWKRPAMPEGARG